MCHRGLSTADFSALRYWSRSLFTAGPLSRASLQEGLPKRRDGPNAGTQPAAVIGFGSGVVIAPGEVITNCHVIEDGVRLRVSKGSHTSPAYVRFYDKRRDLCQLHAARAESFTRPVRGVVAMDDLRVGQRVYAIGGPRGLELTLSDGLISGLRQNERGSVQVNQTTARISLAQAEADCLIRTAAWWESRPFCWRGVKISTSLCRPAGFWSCPAERQYVSEREELLSIGRAGEEGEGPSSSTAEKGGRGIPGSSHSEGCGGEAEAVRRIRGANQQEDQEPVKSATWPNGNPEAVYSVTLLPEW